jgi:hypothetical protein
MAVTQNAWDSANNPQQPANYLWGKCEIRAETVGLVKGIGKEPFDPVKHQRAWTSIEVFIDPLPELNIGNLNVCNRNMLAESVEWGKFVLKSIHDLGIQNVREVDGLWVRVETVPTGDTYEKDGKTKDRTTFKFVAAFKNEDECRKAYLAENGNNGQAAPNPAPAQQATSTSERDMAFKFLTTIVSNAWKTSSGNYDAAKVEIAAKIAQLPLITKHFNVDGTEIAEMLMQLATK